MIFLSPGVKTREIDYSTYVGEISSCIVGMVGAATKGPIGVPTYVTSPTDFVETFGEPTPNDYGSYCALEYLKQGSQLFYVRVGESTLAKAKATCSAGLVTVTLKEEGTYGNAFSFELLKGEIDEEDGVTQLYSLVIYRNETQEETFTVSFDSERDDWIENVESFWVDVEYNEDQEIQPLIQSFTGFEQDDNNKWVKNVLVGSETLDTITFETNVPCANAQLKVVVDNRADGAFLPGDSVGITVVDENTFTVTGLGIEFPDTTTYTPDEPVSQGAVAGTKTYDAPGAATADTETFTESGSTAAAITFPVDVSSFQPTTTPTADPVDAIKADFIAWLLTLGIDSDGTGTAITASDVESLITITPTAGTPVAGTVTSNAPGSITEGAVGDATYKMTYAETTPYTESTAYVVSLNLTSVYFDNGGGTKVEGDFAFEYSFDLGDSYDSVETFEQTYVKDPSTDEFTIEFKINLVAETGLASDENIIINSVTSAALVTAEESTDGPTVPTVIKPVIKPTTAPVWCEGGDDGAPVSVQKVYQGLALFENTEDYDINLLAAPGRFEASIVTKLIEVSEKRADTFAIIDPPQGLSYRDAIAFHNGKLAGDQYPKNKLNSSYAGFFYPWVQVYDTYSGNNIWLPPSGVVLASFAYNDNVAQPWFAAAGLNRGMLKSVLDLEVTLDEAKRDALYGNGNAINALVNYKQQGFTIWGNKTLQRKTSALDRINVRRLVNMVRKAIAATSSYLIFEQNDELTWGQWKNQVDPYLDTIKRSRGLIDFKTQMDEETVTDYYKDRNQMPGKVWLKPTKTAEFIPIDFILTSSGASFSD